MLGIVLCGGQSARMGTDKGLLVNEARTWAQTAVDKLTALSVAVKISVNESQLAAYSQVFTGAALVCDDAALDIKGPLRGVLSAHLQHPGADLLVLACDMPLMEKKLLKELYDCYASQKNFDAYLFTDNNEPEPLCAIYTATGLLKITAALKSNQLKKHSMKYALSLLPVYSIALSNEQKKHFRNFNAHAELNGL